MSNLMEASQTQTSFLAPLIDSAVYRNSILKQSKALKEVEKAASEKAVVIYSVSTCCLCHAVKRLFCSLGVAPAIYEIDQEHDGPEIERALQRIAGGGQPIPAVFIGSRYVGGLDQLIAAHICGALVPRLKEAGALWL
ncbi:hypothetical protein O6H91_03G015000 [Diphasiastrum complanatum]|uniref:Uncharacterized protein n=1 Tax=Diphasiastrum complanatum TaxID=34168 RepID=A0ACC2E3U5_DIPCM|nr:hypothetical protein O6H91_03G015000 [Diphasiastrum complanatum]